MTVRPASPRPTRTGLSVNTSSHLIRSVNRPPVDPLLTHRTSVSRATPIGVPAPGPAHWPSFLPREMPRLAFPMFCVVATAPSVVVIAIPAALFAFGLPALSGLALGILAIGLTWGGLAILMRYQEMWESAPPEPQHPWTPPAHAPIETDVRS